MNVTEIILIIFSGVLATLGMSLSFTLFIFLILLLLELCISLDLFLHKVKKMKVLLIAWFFHFVFGIIFAFIYTLVLKTIPGIIKYSFSFLVAGAALGFIHGIVFALILLILVAEHHPVQKYRELGFGGAIYYFLAHIVYGLVFGLSFMLFLS